MNSFGNFFKFTIFGQSHAPAIGVTIEGVPSGFKVDFEELQSFLDRRAPGKDRFSTSRKEADAPEFIAGLSGENADTACGCPITAIIRNTNTRSSDYEYMRYIPRPGHSDYSAMMKYGIEERDYSGGGQFSGRLTAPMCIAGGIALQLLKKEGIEVSARYVMIGGKTDPDEMLDIIDKIKAGGDSVGGIIECTIKGVPAGVGEPMFGGMENRISQAVFGIPAVKGIEFGAGFAAASMLGSQNNDPFVQSLRGGIETETNNAGGILGGITNGMPIVFRAAFKPTPSISIPQKSVDIRTGKPKILEIKGRHDPCIVLRAVPVVEAAAACAVYDALLEAKAYK